VRLVVVGGSDAGISAALRGRELDPDAQVTVIVPDAFPNFSVCGIPYYVAGEVGDWRRLAHRSAAELEGTGMQLRLDTVATAIDVAGRRVSVRRTDGGQEVLAYDELIVGTGAVPVRPPIDGLTGPAALGPADGVHVLHTMGDTFAVQQTLQRPPTARARQVLIVGAGYVGLEMAEALTARGLQVVQVVMLPEVLPTVDPELGSLVRAELTRRGVEVHTDTTVTAISRAGGCGDGAAGRAGRLHVAGSGPAGDPVDWDVDLVLVVVGVRPDTDLLAAAGAHRSARGGGRGRGDATGLPHVWAAGDCVVTHHRLAGVTWLPLGTTAHKQGRVAGENAVGGDARFAGSLGTQVVKVFDLVAARTGLREPEAAAAGHRPASTTTVADDHKAYYPGAQPITIRVTGDAGDGRLLGAQLIGALGTETAKRVDVYATALFHGMTVDALSALDLSYTPPLGSPWDAVQTAAQAWVRQHAPARPPTDPTPA
jgi:NADPH-dependent 2,4-dienoyl-CoA reductase/sulfur reductase-like enzyme